MQLFNENKSHKVLHQPWASPKGLGAEIIEIGDTDIDDDIDMDDMGTPHTTVTSQLLNINKRDICFYEDWTHSPTEPSHVAVHPPTLSLQQIVYDPPDLDLKTWRAILLPRLAIPLKGKYHCIYFLCSRTNRSVLADTKCFAVSQNGLNERIRSQITLGWKIFFLEWDVKQIYGDMCPSVGVRTGTVVLLLDRSYVHRY